MSALKLLIAPNGKPVVGTLETIPGVAIIYGGVRDKETGLFKLEYGGETQIDWDNQKSLELLRLNHRKQSVMARIFVDDDGNQWTEDQLVLEGSKPKKGKPLNE